VATGGIGLNLTQATTVIYYSNTFSYEDRKQSEDRAHRIGQTADKVLYIDLQAQNTVDSKIIAALLLKENLATYMNDLKNCQL
jgi:SNF2 family DNA or RNA helicase